MNKPYELDRRTLLGQILLLAGAATIPAGCALAHNSNGSDFAFDADQRELLSAIADTIIPKGDTVGALDVGVPQSFEQLMRNWASAETREEILAGLGRVDAVAEKAQGKPFARLDTATRLAVLKVHEPEALKPNLEKASKGGGIAVMMGPPAMDDGYSRMRNLIIKLFYLSEPALTQELSYAHEPGGYKPSVPVTPDLRPAGGLSPI
jgi:gluconate 2-dehydrogenase gamma chain